MPTVPVRIPQISPYGGIKTNAPSDELGEGFSTKAFNVRFMFNSVREGPGRSLLAGPSSAETVRRITRFSNVEGINWPLKITDTRLYRWGGTLPATPRQWHACLGPAMNGTSLFDVASGEDRVFFTRYAEPVSETFHWNGVVTSPYVRLVAASGTAPPAKFVEYFNNRVILGFTFEGGGKRTNRIRWSVNGDFLDWAGSGSGFLDFYDPEEEPITGMGVLGDRLVIYRRHSITDVIATGILLPVHESEVRVSGFGTVAPYTIASTGLQHFFLSSDKSVYSWDGVQVQNIGEPIKRELQALIDDSKLEMYFGFVSQNTQEYFLILDTGDAFVYNYVYDTWSRDTYGDITAADEVMDSSTTLTWDNIEGSWDETTLTWAQGEATQRPRIFAGRSDGGTFIIDEQVVYDYYTIGSIVDRYCETRDHYFPNDDLGLEGDPFEDGTIQRVMFIYTYNTDLEPFLFGLSMDRGVTWIEREIFPTPANFSIAEFNSTGRPVRFRMRSNNANQRFQWSSFAYEFVEAGPTNP